ncbi:unnamed protein product, partial [Gulo gulo]
MYKRWADSEHLKHLGISTLQLLANLLCANPECLSRSRSSALHPSSAA